MSISDIRTRVDALNERSRLVMRSAESDENTTVTLVDTPQGTDAESSEMPDPLIQALIDRLPKSNTIWSIDDRAKWLRAAAIIFNLVYRSENGERKEPSSKEKTEKTTSPVLSAVS